MSRLTIFLLVLSLDGRSTDGIRSSLGAVVISGTARGAAGGVDTADGRNVDETRVELLAGRRCGREDRRSAAAETHDD